MALLVRTYVGAPIVSFLAPRLISPRSSGFMRGLAMTGLNVAVTSPISSAVIAALFADPSDFSDAYIATLTTTMPITMLVSFFIVGPAVKLVFHNRISPAGGLRALQTMERFTPALSRLLGM